MAQSPERRATNALIPSADTRVEAMARRVNEANSPTVAREAFEALRSASGASTDAALACGVLSSTHGSVVYSRPTALACLKSAANAGVPTAQLRLAEVLLEGSPSDADRESALQWLARSSQLPESVYRLALARAGDATDPASARRSVIERAAAAGHAPAQYAFAQLLYSDESAARRTQALEWLGKAAAQGDAEAATESALILAARKRDEDTVRVIALLERAAEGGSARGRYELGRRYLEALGVKRDTVKGFELTRLAAHAGDLEAQYAVGTLLSQGRGTGSDDGAAFDWFRFAAARGHAEAIYAVATSYANGWGVGKSLDLAYQWYCRAARAGHRQARTLIERRAPGECPLDQTAVPAPR